MAFLDKIVDFPRWLPTPSPASLRRLAARDLERMLSDELPLPTWWPEVETALLDEEA